MAIARDHRLTHRAGVRLYDFENQNHSLTDLSNTNGIGHFIRIAQMFGIIWITNWEGEKFFWKYWEYSEKQELHLHYNEIYRKAKNNPIWPVLQKEFLKD